MSRSWRRLFALASTASLALFATAAPAGTGKLSADPATTVTAATPLIPGLSSLGNGADLYVPPGIAGPRPLLLLFPGTGGNGPR